jgi:cell division protein FtsB
MPRNRKSQSAAIRFGPALKALLLCLLIGGSGVGYVWQKEQIAWLGQQIKKQETVLKSMEAKNKELRQHLADMRSPLQIKAQIKKDNLGLVLPTDSQILRLPEPVPAPPQADHETQYAARNDRVAFGQ